MSPSAKTEPAEQARLADLRAVAERGASELGPDATAEQLLAWTAETFADRFIVASNMQDAVLVDLAAKAKPGVDILFLETGYHFAETIGTRDAVGAVYDVTIVNALPDRTVAEQDAAEGQDLFAREPDRCCHLRKVVPLQRTLAGYDAWVTGVRRVEAPTRANTPLIQFDEKHGLVKINPLAAWSDEDMDAYIDEHNVLVNPLVPAGYPSIGCAPCTAKPLPGADPRSGRWAGRAKTECGLHA
ncbi:phosphoadenylyl-sulfate reductase [Pseudonocardia bannensis]|uniref:Adenosine 5'-phosphosulfate reductase n=1 Tax=Pseudonocardia bannensis TaxID=630973 RepID=A0A848DRE6_9PSEU|nr:phosphoadenylyl-sulfate reductase [Pseudonocardia bannensis]NMH95382.1 phosphoadenylyl-sulfate reductase [Pseudonocardia bannensis]